MVDDGKQDGGPLSRLPYREIWAVDFEFIAKGGNRPAPVCMVAKDLRSGRELRLWQDALQRHSKLPFDVGPDVLFVAYYASAELGCFLAPFRANRSEPNRLNGRSHANRHKNSS